ncbi:probable calcium-binding protein CML44 [Macadamia integrifolia]|uniref:probable calcium-binding protein CML44 n=1 Tax=Macadamia integrifolia TaxID=60698 RepID=UPI001C4F5A8C|nr:probable calcium-binding protein CML44 [Macadamia integrifolia]
MPRLSYGDLNRIFNKLDRNGDGYVTAGELHWVLDRVGILTSREEVEYTLKQDSLDLQEFIGFYESIEKPCEVDDKAEEERDDEVDLVEAFKVFDLNNDGFISCEELQSVLSRLGLWEETRGDCRNMIRKFDTNSDGLVDFEEFKAMMLLTSP